MLKTIQEIRLTALPPKLDQCFDVISRAGAIEFALFGGAVRDADYAACHNVPRPIKDYDVRVWLPPDSHQRRTEAFIARLGETAAATIHKIPAEGTTHVRYCFDLDGTEVDVSVRPWKLQCSSLASVAIDRAMDADIGLCSVAIASDGSAWATPEYLQDRNNRTLSVYPNSNQGRLEEYTVRMLQKFPDHSIVQLHQ